MFRDKSASRTCPVGRFAVTTVDDSETSCYVPVCSKPCSCCDCDPKNTCKVACCVKSCNCVPPCFDYDCKDDCKTIACKSPCSNPCKSIPPCYDYYCKDDCKTVACKNPCKSIPPCFDYDCKDNCKTIACKNPCSDPCKSIPPCYDYDCKSLTFKSVKDGCKGAPACASKAIGCFPGIKLNAGDSHESFCKPVCECCSLTSCCDQDVKNVVVCKGKQPCGKMTGLKLV